MGGKGKKRHQNLGGQLGKKQKQGFGKNKDDGADGSAIILMRSKKHTISSNYPVPGLMNLGNTCFFNSVMQNLAQTHYLQQRMKQILSLDEFPITIPSPNDLLPPLSVTVNAKPGKFAEDFHTFVLAMRDKPKQPLNPRVVFSHVCKNAPRFSSHQQQDSQELLRYLLDALRNEEINRIKRAILDSFNVRTKSSEKITISEQEKKAIKAYGIQALQSHTFVEDVFGGKTVSSVTCLECKTRYEIEEDFLDLSLPVPSETPKVGFSSRSSLKNKKRFGHRSSEDAEGDDEGEGLNYKSARNKDEPSKHQLKQKRKEERKRSKGKQRYTLDQFNKETPLEEHNLGQEQPPHNISTVKRSASETTMDSCLADDEVTFLSTQQDSDSSALFIQTTHRQDNCMTECNNQNFTAENSSDEKKATTTNMTVPVEKIVEKIEGMTLYHNENLSESVVAMFENTSKVTSIQQSPNGTPLHSPLTKENVQQQQITDDKTHPLVNEDIREDEPIVDDCLDTQTVSIIPVISLQNIEDVVTDNNVPSLDEEHIDNNDNDSSIVETGLTGCDHNESSMISSENKSNNDLSKPLVKPIDRYSLSNCLQQFTASELLTGSDRFCCESCSQGNSQKKDDNLRNGSSNSIITSEVHVTDEKILSKQNECGLSEGVPGNNEEEQTEDRLPALVEREDETDSLERSVSTTSSSSNCKEEDEDTEMLESTKESDDTDSHSSLSGVEAVVFRDAIKQMLITTPPSVLCLHLKRFIQQGRTFRNMRKNSCHISFPLLLDIAPYCTQQCIECIGKSDQGILYSLYGVVVHGGGMHGGHYTAFVRVRNELQLKDVIISIKDVPVATVQEEMKLPTVNKEESLSEKLESESVTILPDNNTNSDAKTDSPIRSNNIKSDHVTKSSSNHQYDMSIVDGCWYHISDSHVRKATESDVLRSEAYLLFYERLPFK